MTDILSFIPLLHGLMSSDNDVRQSAETFYNNQISLDAFSVLEHLIKILSTSDVVI